MSDQNRNRTEKSDVTFVRISLGLVVLFSIASTVHKTFTIPWFTMTEEFPYAQEVLRFVAGDWRQRFFDIPGTPFIGIVTAVYAPILVVWSFASGHTKPIAELAFEHLDLLYFVMRSVSLLSFAIASWLVFRIARRFSSQYGALVGAVVFVTHPILALTLHHTRIEPFGALLVSASILAWLRGIESGRWRWCACAGGLSGLAMAARFPLASATLPVFLVYALAKPEPVRGFAKTIDRSLAVILFVVAVVGGGLAVTRISGLTGRNALSDTFFLSIPHGGYPHATLAVARIWIVLGISALLIGLMAVTRTGQRLFGRYLESTFVSIAVFFPVGLLLGVPTLFAGADFFLASIEMFVQRNALAQPNIGTGPWNVILYYLFGPNPLSTLFDLRPFWDPQHYPAIEGGVLFNIPLVILFCCGWFTRPTNRLAYWGVLLGCCVGIASQFGKLQTTRHLAGWIPWFCVVIAAGADVAFNRGFSRRVLIALGAAFLSVMLWQRSVLSAQGINDLAEKAVLQADLNRWLNANISSEVPVFHTCCEPITPPVIFSWMQTNGVVVPARYLENGSTIWFGELSTLRRAGDGYVITSRRTYPGQYVDYYTQMNPKELVDVYHDPRFERRHIIAGTYDIFYFILEGLPRLVSGGITVREATYGENCAAAPTRGGSNLVRRGNATRTIARACNRRDACDFTLTPESLADPAPFCAKDLKVSWTCPDGRSEEIVVQAEALGKTIHLRCGGISAGQPPTETAPARSGRQER